VRVPYFGKKRLPKGASKPSVGHGNRQHCGDSQDFYGDVHLPIQSFTLESFNVSVGKHFSRLPRFGVPF